MRISQRANYIKGLKKESYLLVLKEIADFIGVNVKEIKRDRGMIIENNYEVRSVTIRRDINKISRELSIIIIKMVRCSSLDKSRRNM